MKKLFVLFISALFLQSCTAIQDQLEKKTLFHKSSCGSQTIKFLSYNIQLDGLDIANHEWINRKHVVATLIAYADIIALQEITHTQLCDLRILLPDYTFVGINTVSGKNLEEISSSIQEGLVVAFRTDFFSYNTNEMQWYSDTPFNPSQIWGSWKSAFPKALQIVGLQCRLNNKTITILTVILRMMMIRVVKSTLDSCPLSMKFLY
jgi:hypothetical protein